MNGTEESWEVNQGLRRLLSSKIKWARFIKMVFQFFIWLGWILYCSASFLRLPLPFNKSLNTLALKVPL